MRELTQLSRRLNAIEKLTLDNAGSLAKQLQALDGSHRRMKNAHDELHGMFREGQAARDSSQSAMDDRVAYMQSFITEFFDKYARELEGAQGKLREVNTKMMAFENSKTSMEQSCDYLSNLVTEQGTKSIELNREMD